jgi:hypothetical protein
MDKHGEMQYPSMETRAWLRERNHFLELNRRSMEKEILKLQDQVRNLLSRVDEYKGDMEMIQKFKDLVDEYSEPRFSY